MCDAACYTAACHYDFTDCTDPYYECDTGCMIFALGDGYCDPECNTDYCNFDNGDCP